MFQREFAMRLVARPGSGLWSRLSANVQVSKHDSTLGPMSLYCVRVIGIANMTRV